MTENNICANCKDHCCQHPMLLAKDIVEMSEKLGCAILDIPVKKCDMSKLHYLKHLDLQFYEMYNPNHCFAFEPGKGCKLPHELKPVICRLYPWVPHNFDGDEWELLLDVKECPHWKHWGQTLEAATKEFEKIRNRNPGMWKT